MKDKDRDKVQRLEADLARAGFEHVEEHVGEYGSYSVWRLGRFYISLKGD